jgi:hypothetical protein
MAGDASLPRLTRRGFLRGAGLLASLTVVANLRAFPATAKTTVAPISGSVFSAGEIAILTQIVERMVDTGDPRAPRVRDTGAIGTIDRIVSGLDPAVTRDLPLALRLFEWGPFLFDFTPTRFSSMNDAEKDASLSSWMTSRLAVRRMGFMALRNLAFLGYYSQDAVWPLVGYAGPLLGRRGAP